ncbi:MAG: chorismate synthase [Muribaculaceae bacterium]|nr:chorismate synthase [Muribaculaceae bacterium]
MRNSIGNIFRLTGFGESHGVAIGGVIDGMPAGVKIDLGRVQEELNRRRPGQSAIVTARNEHDNVKILSGLFEGITTGTPIGFVIENTNQHSGDYSNIKDAFRPSHADYTYTAKYGVRDYRGGGRSSARETAVRVVAGAFARQALEQYGVEIYAYTSQVGNIALDKDYRKYDKDGIENNTVRCPDAVKAQEMIRLIEEVKAAGDTVGGVITCVIKGVPVGIGEPVFDKLHARLGAAMLGINAVKGFEYGLGFDFAEKRGSEVADAFCCENGKITTLTNNSGGIQGGISNGEDIYFRVAFKPVATLLRDVDTIDTEGNDIVLRAKGRHDPCVLPRAVPIVEAMAAIVILDNILINKTVKL